MHDLELGPALEPELRRHASLGAVMGTTSVYVGSIAQGLGWLAAVRGDTAAAVEHFRTALRAHESLRSPIWCRRSQDAMREVTGNPTAP